MDVYSRLRVSSPNAPLFSIKMPALPEMLVRGVRRSWATAARMRSC